MEKDDYPTPPQEPGPLWFFILVVIIGVLLWQWRCDECGGDGENWLRGDCGACKGSGMMIVKLITSE